MFSTIILCLWFVIKIDVKALMWIAHVIPKVKVQLESAKNASLGSLHTSISCENVFALCPIYFKFSFVFGWLPT